MKHLSLAIVIFLLGGCGKLSDTISTGTQGYSLRCIDGTQYILMSSDSGLAITPSVGTNGLPKACDQ